MSQKLAIDVASLLDCYPFSSITFSLLAHKAPCACTKLPRRLKTNLRYETSPQSRPVVGNTKLGELYWVLSDNKTSLQDFAVSSFFLQSLLDEKSLASTKYRKALILFGSSLILLKTVWSNENCQICILVLSGILLMNKEKLM